MRKTYYRTPFIIVLVLLGCLSTGLSQNIVKPTVKAPNGFDVNSFTGNLYHQRIDMRMPAQGIPMEIVFSYNNTQRNKNWGYGPGWTFTYNVAYTKDSLNNIVVLRADGRRDIFTKTGVTYKAPVGVFDTLAEYQAGKFRLNTKEGWTYYFDVASHRKLTKVQDRNNNAVTINYTDSLPTAITDAAGRSFALTWDNGRLKEIQNACASPVRKIAYTYDTSGNPVKVMRPDSSSLQYYYDENSRIIGFTDELGNNMSITYNGNGAVSKIVSCATTQLFTYSPQTRKTFVTEQVQGQRQITTYSYDTTGRVIHKEGNCCGYNVAYQYDENNNVSSQTNGNNQTTQYVYDAKGNVIKETDAEGYSMSYTWHSTLNKPLSVKDKRGNTTSYEYDAAGNQTKILRPLGITVEYTYDSKGNVLTQKDGNNHITRYEYNTYGLLTKTTDALNGIVTNTYDGCGNLTQVKDARNNVTSYEYDLQNRVTKITDALGGITKYTYDIAGNLSSATDALHQTTTYHYDGLGRQTKTISPSGHTVTVEYDERGNKTKITDPRGNSTFYTYNSRNQVLTERDALGKTKSFDYDGAGNMVSETDKRGNTTKYEYDKLNRIIKTINAAGNTSTISYDENGNRKAATDYNGNITYFSYDALNRLAVMTDPYNKTILYTYDANNNLLAQQDKNGKVWSKEYDALNRPTKSIDPLGYFSVITYDANDNRLSIKNELGHTTSYSYDALNRQLTETNALNEVNTQTYDAAGNVLSVSFPNGNVISTVYDNEYQVTTISDALGIIGNYTYDANGNRITEKDANNNTVNNSYNEINQLYSITDALGSTSSKEYDANGNLLTETDRNRNSKQFTYDALNRITQETNALGNTTRFEYDGNGNRIRIIDAKNNITSYNVDALNRLIRESYADGTKKDYTYDANGNRKTRRDNKGNITSYSYDDANRLTQCSYPGGQNETFSYDAVGQRLTANNINATISFTYDPVGRMLTETLNGRTTSYSYSTIAHTRTLTYPSGRTIKETRNQRDKLTSVSEGSNNLTQFSYDAASRLITKTLGNGAIEQYAYDANNRIITLNCQPNNILHFQYTYDKEGNKLTVIKNHRPTHSEKYEYDNIYQVTGFYSGRINTTNLIDTVSRNIYFYDALQNRISSTEDNISKLYTPNNMNAYKNITVNGSSSVYNHDANGNPLNIDGNNYVYDYENRAISIGNIATYKYDALGRKIASTTPSRTVNYFYDDQRIIEETSGSNELKTYVFGSWVDDLLHYKSGTNEYYICNNNQGSVLAVMQQTNVIDRYEYDVFGMPSYFSNSYVLKGGSDAGNSTLFHGRLLNEDNNYDFRARRYHSTAGRFFQRDALEYLDSYNAYQFINNSSPNKNDNYGLSSTICGFADVYNNSFYNRLFQIIGENTSHSYKVKTRICEKDNRMPNECDKSKDGKECTKAYVFDLMISKKKFIAPIDFGAGGDKPLTDCAVSRLFGNNLYTYGLTDFNAINKLISILPGSSLSNNFSFWGNPVFTKINGDYSITNYTLFPHLFFPGTIKRTVVEESDGVYVRTDGIGASISQSVKYTNIYGGELIFKTIDLKLAEAYHHKH